MKKQIHDHLVALYREHIPQYQQVIREHHRQFDNVIVWLTTISTGAIALIIYQADNLFIDNPFYLKASVLLLVFSIIFCVIFRSFNYLLEGLWRNKLFIFEGFCFISTIEPSGPMKIHETETIEDIAKRLKNDMGIDCDHWLEHDYLGRDFWVETYNSWADFWKKTEEEGIMRLSKAIAILNNKDPEEAENILTVDSDDKKTTKQIKIYSFICKWAYQLSMISFVLAVLSISIGFMGSASL